MARSGLGDEFIRPPQSGAEAAGTILSSPSHLQAVIQKLPPDWPSKNLDVLLHSRVIRNAPSPPEVVAWELW